MEEKPVFNHVPVMLREVLSGLDIKPSGIYVDGTAGGGNHSFAIGSKLSSDGKLICTDRDSEAIRECEKKLSPLKCRVEIIHSEFTGIPDILQERSLKADGLLVDLGVSSYQLSNAERGFSYMNDGILDMRMNPEKGISAKEIVNEYPKEKLEKIFFEYGEERYSRKIASNIVAEREKRIINTTSELSEIIIRSMPPAALREKQHPAKRVFQAIRIAVNDELNQIYTLLDSIVPNMNSGGRISVITFHSLEDKIVKSAFSTFERPCTCPPEFPVCVCGKKSMGRCIGKVTAPSAEEVSENPKSRSAKLRIFEVK